MQQAVSIFFSKEGNLWPKAHTAGQANLYVILTDLNVHFQAFLQSKQKWNGISDTYNQNIVQ